MTQIDDELFAMQAADVSRGPTVRRSVNRNRERRGRTDAVGRPAQSRSGPRCRPGRREGTPTENTGRTIRLVSDDRPVGTAERPVRAFGQSQSVLEDLGPVFVQAQPEKPQTRPATPPAVRPLRAAADARAEPAVKADAQPAAATPPTDTPQKEPLIIQQLPDGRIVINGRRGQGR